MKVKYYRMATVRIVTGAQGAAFTGPNAVTLKTVNVFSTGPTGAIGGQIKTHTQTGAAGLGPNATLLLAPTGTVGVKSVIIPGFAGPA